MITNDLIGELVQTFDCAPSQQQLAQLEKLAKISVGDYKQEVAGFLKLQRAIARETENGLV